MPQEPRMIISGQSILTVPLQAVKASELVLDSVIAAFHTLIYTLLPSVAPPSWSYGKLVFKWSAGKVLLGEPERGEAGLRGSRPTRKGWDAAEEGGTCAFSQASVLAANLD